MSAAAAAAVAKAAANSKLTPKEKKEVRARLVRPTTWPTRDATVTPL
jgi:hypothetical protein